MMLADAKCKGIKKMNEMREGNSTTESNMIEEQ